MFIVSSAGDIEEAGIVANLKTLINLIYADAYTATQLEVEIKGNGEKKYPAHLPRLNSQSSYRLPESVLFFIVNIEDREANIATSTPAPMVRILPRRGAPRRTVRGKVRP